MSLSRIPIHLVGRYLDVQSAGRLELGSAELKTSMRGAGRVLRLPKTTTKAMVATLAERYSAAVTIDLQLLPPPPPNEPTFTLWGALAEEWPFLELLVLRDHFQVPPFEVMGSRDAPWRLQVGGVSRHDVNELVAAAYETSGFTDESVCTVTVTASATNKAMYSTVKIVCGDGRTTFKAECRGTDGGVDEVMAMEEFAEVTEGVDEDLLFEDPYTYPGFEDFLEKKHEDAAAEHRQELVEDPYYSVVNHCLGAGGTLEMTKTKAVAVASTAAAAAATAKA